MTKKVVHENARKTRRDPDNIAGVIPFSISPVIRDQ
jgi:hypothetical protein